MLDTYGPPLKPGFSEYLGPIFSAHTARKYELSAEVPNVGNMMYKTGMKRIRAQGSPGRRIVV